MGSLQYGCQIPQRCRKQTQSALLRLCGNPNRTEPNSAGLPLPQLEKYYLNDGSIDFLSFAETCAEAVKKQGYNHDNYQTLTTYPLLSTPPATNLSPRQFDQWHYDYLDAQITARQNRVANPFYRLLYGIGQEILQTADNNKILSLLDKYEIPAFKNCFNEYRFIIKQQSSYRPHNLAQLRQQQKAGHNPA